MGICCDNNYNPQYYDPDNTRIQEEKERAAKEKEDREKEEKEKERKEREKEEKEKERERAAKEKEEKERKEKERREKEKKEKEKQEKERREREQRAKEEASKKEVDEYFEKGKKGLEYAWSNSRKGYGEEVRLNSRKDRVVFLILGPPTSYKGANEDIDISPFSKDDLVDIYKKNGYNKVDAEKKAQEKFMEFYKWTEDWFKEKKQNDKKR